MEYWQNNESMINRYVTGNGAPFCFLLHLVTWGGSGGSQWFGPGFLHSSGVLVRFKRRCSPSSRRPCKDCGRGLSSPSQAGSTTPLTWCSARHGKLIETHFGKWFLLCWSFNYCFNKQIWTVLFLPLRLFTCLDLTTRLNSSSVKPMYFWAIP